MIYVALIVLGLCLGSFVNALVWRLHKQEAVSAKGPTHRNELQNLSIVHGRSMCMHCKHELAPMDLVPVLSWAYLRGKCRYCKHSIDDTPLAELVLPALLALSYSVWPYTSNAWSGMDIALFALWTGALTCLLALSIYDAKWYLLPDRIVAPLTGCAVVFSVLLATIHNDLMVFVYAALGGLLISGIFLTLAYISKGTWIGGGDIKIGVSLGLLAGTPLMALLVIFIASLLGTIYMLPSIVSGKKKLESMLPFGPFLILATYIVFLWGDSLFSWYQTLFFL